MAENRNVNVKINIETSGSVRETKALNDEVKKLRDELAQIGKTSDQASDQIAKIPKSKGEFEDFSNKVKNTGFQVNDLVKAFTLASLATAGLFKAMDVLKTAFVTTWTDAVAFNKEILAIETIMPKGQKVTQEMTETLKSMATAFGTTTATQAKAFYDILSAGIEDTADATRLLDQANQLAIGGIAETKDTINLLTTVYNVYGKELVTSGQAADSLFKTVQLGKTNISQLSNELGQSLPIAKQFGLTIDEVGANLVQFTNAGISTAESTTLLNALLSAIAKKGAELGPTMNESAVQTDGLAVVLDRLKEKTNLSTEALFKLLGRQEAVRAAQILGRVGLENYNKTLDEYTTKAGVAAEASAKMTSEMGKQFDKLWQKTKNGIDAWLGFSELWIPATKGLITGINDMSDAWVKLRANMSIEQSEEVIKLWNKALAEGTVTVQEHTHALEKWKKVKAEAEAELSSISPAKPQDNSNFWEQEKKNLQNQLTLIEMGMSDIPPLEQKMKIKELNMLLAETEKQIKTISLGGPALPAPPANVEEDPKAKQARLARERILEERALLESELTKKEEEFQALQTETAAQQEAQRITDETERNLAIIEADRIQKQALLDAELNFQLQKAEMIKDGKNSELAQMNAFAQWQIADEKLKQENAKKVTAENFKKETKDKDDKIKIEKALAKGRAETLQAGFNLAATIAQDGSKEQFLIMKAAALSQAILSMLTGIAQANLVPPPGNIAAAAYAKATGVLNIAAITASVFKGFASGGVVGDGALTGDRNLIRVNRKERVLTPEQNRGFEELVYGNGASGLGNNTVIVELLSNIEANSRQAPVVMMDGTVLSTQLNRINNLRLV